MSGHDQPHLDDAFGEIAHALDERSHVKTWGSRLAKLLPVAIVVGGITAASAATLGLSPDSVASGGATVEGCDTSVNVDYTTDYDPTDGAYKVTEVVVSEIDATACAGQTLDVVVADDKYVALGSGSATVSAGTMTLTLSSAVPADEVAHVAVVITG
jgi:ATP-dependent protease HslVU (ClpYQ) peptidase subunit